MRATIKSLTVGLVFAQTISGCGSDTTNLRSRNMESAKLHAGCRTQAGIALAEGPLFSDELTSLPLLGEAHVYPERPTVGDMRAESLRYLVGDGTLTTPTLASEPQGFAKAESANHVFRFGTKSEAFRETTAFAYAVRMREFLSGLDPELDKDCETVTISVLASNTADAATRSNAAYTPSDRAKDRRARVTLGPGDGREIGDLALDFDAVAHEVAHHLLFQYVRVLRGDAVTLHEGLADYFVFAATGDACLAESVCRSGGTVCSAAKACLRTGQNKLSWTDPSLSLEPHLRGQVISGLLWSLATDDGLGTEQVALLVVNALQLLPAEPLAADFAEALLEADAKLSAGRNADEIRKRSCERGLSDCH